MVVGDKPGLKRGKLERLSEKVGIILTGIAMIPSIAYEFYKAVTKKDETQIQYRNKQPYLNPEKDRIII